MEGKTKERAVNAECARQSDEEGARQSDEEGARQSDEGGARQMARVASHEPRRWSSKEQVWQATNHAGGAEQRRGELVALS